MRVEIGIPGARQKKPATGIASGDGLLEYLLNQALPIPIKQRSP